MNLNTASTTIIRRVEVKDWFREIITFTERWLNYLSLSDMFITIASDCSHNNVCNTKQGMVHYLL